MAVYDNKRYRIGAFGAVMIVFAILAYAGLRYLYEGGYGLIYEVSYALALLIALAIIYDRLFVR